MIDKLPEDKCSQKEKTMQTSMPIEIYQTYYDFTLQEHHTTLSALERALQIETIPKRREIINERLTWARRLDNVCNVLSVGIISLPMNWGNYMDWNTKAIYIHKPQLYVGGLDKRIVVVYPDTQWGETNLSIYMGDLPHWVFQIYKQAQPLVDEVIVVSRDARLFNVKAVGYKISPLLIGCIGTEFILLAAWGLEHELPKSLGGLLDDR